MLIQFRTENHLSLKDQQTLSLVAGSLAEDIPGTIATELSGIELLRVAAVYGANASGKSNVLKSLSFMAHAVTASHRHWEPNKEVPRSPFLLDPHKPKEPSLFEADLLLDGVRYKYGFTLDSESIIEEWLYAYPRGRRQLWFSRTKRNATEFTFGKHLGGENRAIEALTRPNSLFLSAAAQNNHKQLDPIYSWFSTKVGFAHPANEHLRLQMSIDMAKEGIHKETLLALMKAADLGIIGIQIKANDPPPKYNELVDAISKVLDIKDKSLVDPARARKNFQAASLVHRSEAIPDGVALPMNTESTGTATLFSLSGSIILALQEGRTLCIDELDAGLHPSLGAEVVRLFNDPEKNPKHAQLIFNTHNTNLLSDKLLRRDQIWFTEKDKGGATHIYPLTDFKPRKQENLERGYLQGRYGAIPFFGSMNFFVDPETKHG